MQDHWSKVHQDMRAIYEKISAPEKDEKSAATSSGTEEQSKVRIREAIYKIRTRAKHEGKPLSRVYQEYIANSSLSPAEKAKVKARVMGTSEEYVYHMESLQFDEQTGQYKVRVTESNSGKMFVRTISLQKVHELRSMPDSYNFATEAKKLDPVGQEDGDIDNDGDEDKNDEYLKKRRKAIGAAIENQKEELEVHEDLMSRTLDKMEEGVRDLDPEKGTKERKARLEKKRGMKLDDHPQYKKEEVDQVDENRAAMGRINKEYHRKKEADEMAARAKAPKDKKPMPKRKNDNPMYDPKSAGSSRVKGFKFTGEEVEQVDEADSLAAMQARREKRLAAQRKKMGTSSTGQDFGHDYGISSAERKKRQQAEFDKFVGKNTKKEEVEVTEKKKDDTYLEPDMKKRQANNEKARKELAKGPQMKNPHFEDYDPMDDPDFDHDEAERNRGVSGRNNPKGGKSVKKRLLAKVASKVKEETSMQMSPQEVALQKKKATVDQQIALKRRQSLNKIKSEQIEVDLKEKAPETDKQGLDKFDRYKRMIRHKQDKYGRASVMDKIRTGKDYKEDVETPFGNMKSMVKRAMKRIDANVDGSVDEEDLKNPNEMGEFVPTPDGKKKTTRVKEGYSWRNDLIEVMGDKLDDDSKKKIDVMKGKNKININPKEEVDLSDSLETVVEEEGSEKKYCRLCKKKETKSQCGFGPKMWEKYSVDDASEKEVENAAEESGISDGGVSEELSVKDQMKISREYNRKSPEERRAAVQKAMSKHYGKKPDPKKDTRTDAQKMSDATGPRKGSRYRGD